MQQIPPFKSHVVEFKSQWGEKDGLTIKKTLVAFANTFGGDLYVGVNDDGTVAGLSDIHAIDEKLCSVIRDSIFPSISQLVSTKRLVVDGKHVLHVHVSQGKFPPYSLAQDDPGQVFIRLGYTTSPAGIEDIARLVERNNPLPFEARLSVNQDLSFNACLAFCRDRNVMFDPKVSTDFGFWDPQRNGWTNLASLCSDQGTAQFVLINFADNDKTEIIDAKRISGSIFDMLERALEFVSRYNHAGMKKPTDGSPERIDLYSVNPGAVREVVINQLVHCDYSLGVPNSIHITPDRIDFWSAGSPNDRLGKDLFEYPANRCRNEKLAELLTKLKLMYGLGNGFRVVRKCHPSAPIERLATITGTSVKISLPRIRHAELQKLNTNQRKAFEFAKATGSVTRKDLEKLLGLSQPSCALILKDLVAKGILEKQGAGPRTRYTLSSGTSVD